LIDFPYQQQQGLFASGFYTSVLTPAIAGTTDDAVAAEANAPEGIAEPEPAPDRSAREFTAAEEPQSNHNAGNSKPR
jgi:hypothetical protein